MGWFNHQLYSHSLETSRTFCWYFCWSLTLEILERIGKYNHIQGLKRTCWFFSKTTSTGQVVFFPLWVCMSVYVFAGCEVLCWELTYPLPVSPSNIWKMIFLFQTLFLLFLVPRSLWEHKKQNTFRFHVSKGTPVSCDRLTLHSHGFLLVNSWMNISRLDKSGSIPNIGDECPVVWGFWNLMPRVWIWFQWWQPPTTWYVEILYSN